MAELKKKIKRPYVLSIAGFDPCGGAGVLADIKTFESFKTIGLGVSTCITYQHEDVFEGVDWLTSDQIIKQAEILFSRYKIDFVKIGLIKDFDTLEFVCSYLLKQNPAIKIIWDPILKASAGFDFHKDISAKRLMEICGKLFLITPNLNEIMAIFPGKKNDEGAGELSKSCNVLLKGGHSSERKGYDMLFHKNKIQTFRPKLVTNIEKHGSGCVLSAAILAGLAREKHLPRAVMDARDYIYKFLISSNTKLGLHKF
ncbi:MAG: hypothetical protein A2275_15405 [Bacteroidetes bacterium RIFOXYA12_FULL_35_11]|nr:MAG: hypothetical protein A2X01_14185 [Bacteroidetes bacterium GWF2_35_48]OFY73334.1 MAG: hypothetical protein A2275_15405 [Bacteroidetes bacterium RIFOXYA12_FULL_35_11]OFY93685.1 MAG: hypothetical protein A2491_21330 [Bacteroidetes bacterium RIFOXYC12_FULL_35_7]HBX52267.1 hydroxymethylpyrimidine/phosphomethylpyrimidine kinase [Bacteroidales bacterium]